MTARAGDAMRVTRASTAVDQQVDRAWRADARFAWLTLVIAAWLIGAILAAARASVQEMAPAIFQRAVDSFTIGVIVLAVVCLAIVGRAVRQRRSPRHAFPAGYGVLGGGLVVLLVWEVADRGWVEGVAVPQGIEILLAPTRVLLVIGLVLVASGPLHAAWQSTGVGISRWTAVVSAALILVSILLPGGFAPVSNPWLERAPAYATGELWVMDGDGSHQTRLISSTESGGPANAAFSPDGKRIAFTQFRIGDHTPLDDDGDIWVADADGKHARPLVTGANYQWFPHWSPDGASIVYTEEPPGGPSMASGPAVERGPGLIGPGFLPGRPAQVRGYAHIWRVQADGTGPPQQVTDLEADDRAASYSPDGTRLVFDSTRDGTTRVWVMDVDGANPRRLTVGADDWGATWSPDGRQVAYQSWSGDNRSDPQIWIMSADGSSARQLTYAPTAVSIPSWSPDGLRIAAVVWIDDRPTIWSIATDGTDPQKLTDDPRRGADLTSGGGAWGRDGRIAFTHSEDPPAIADALVREDLAVAAILLTAILVALVAILTVQLRPPFGAFVVIMGVPNAALAIVSEEWRFVPAAIVGGLIVDLLVRMSPERWKAVAAGGGSAAVWIVGATLTVALTSGVGWSLTLISGATVAGMLIGCLLAELIGTHRVAETAA